MIVPLVVISEGRCKWVEQAARSNVLRSNLLNRVAISVSWPQILLTYALRFICRASYFHPHHTNSSGLCRYVRCSPIAVKFSAPRCMTAQCRFCCKSLFALVIKISFGCTLDFRVKMWGTSSPEDKLAGELGNVIEVASTGCRRSDFFYSRKICAGPFGTFAAISALTGRCQRCIRALKLRLLPEQSRHK